MFFDGILGWFGLENIGCIYRRRKWKRSIGKRRNRKGNEDKEFNLE